MRSTSLTSQHTSSSAGAAQINCLISKRFQSPGQLPDVIVRLDQFTGETIRSPASGATAS
jgi:hypothetical protein